MLLRGLGHQNNGDSLAAKDGKEKENERKSEKDNFSISVLLRLAMYLSSHLSSFRSTLFLSNIPYGAFLRPLPRSRSELTSSSVSF